MLCPIADDSDLIVEGNQADLAVWVVFLHTLELRIDGALDTLKARYVCHSIVSLKTLV
jgi:hypothetical protein